MRKSIVLIPAYKPDSELSALVKELHVLEFKILVVNDGSGVKYNRIFEEISEFAEVIGYEQNKGKGNALKFGISYIKENYSDFNYFITADADGQHLPQDILRVDEELSQKNSIVLSTRVLKGKIPLRSRFGNALSRFIFTLLTTRYFTDNQSGLRGFSTQHCDWLINVRGNRYDYEMNALFFAQKQHIFIKTIPVEAVYIDGNYSSHFNPLKDTLKIYRQLFYSARGSFFAFSLSEILLLITSLTVDWKYLFMTLPTIGIITVTFDVFFCRAFSMRDIKFKDFGVMMVRTAIRYSVYIAFIWIMSLALPNLSPFITFNLISLLYVAPEFFLFKLIYKIKTKKSH